MTTSMSNNAENYFKFDEEALLVKPRDLILSHFRLAEVEIAIERMLEASNRNREKRPPVLISRPMNRVIDGNATTAASFILDIKKIPVIIKKP